MVEDSYSDDDQATDIASLVMHIGSADHCLVQLMMFTYNIMIDFLSQKSMRAANKL